MARPTRVLLDVDEVIADFIGYYLDVAGRHMATYYKPEQVTQWKLPEALNLPQWARREMDAEMRRPGVAHKLKLLPGAKDAVLALNEISEVVFVTAPYYGSLTWGNDRVEWLRHHFGDMADKTILTRYKTPVQGDVFVDDRPENLEGWVQENTGKAVVWDKPYNRDFAHELVERVSSWERIIQIVSDKSATK